MPKNDTDTSLNETQPLLIHLCFPLQWEFRTSAVEKRSNPSFFQTAVAAFLIRLFFDRFSSGFCSGKPGAPKRRMGTTIHSQARPFPSAAHQVWVMALCRSSAEWLKGYNKLRVEQTHLYNNEFVYVCKVLLKAEKSPVCKTQNLIQPHCACFLTAIYLYISFNKP